LLSRKAIAVLSRILHCGVRHFDIDQITDILELPNVYEILELMGIRASHSTEAKVKALLAYVNNEPEKLVELLNLLLEYSHLSPEEIDQMRNILEPCGLTTDGSEVKLFLPSTTTKISLRKRAELEQILETSFPDVIARLREAEEALCSGDFEKCTDKCRKALEGLSIAYEYGTGFKKFLRALCKRGLLMEREVDIAIKIYDYVSIFRHEGPKPTKDQAHYIYSLIWQTIGFLALKLRKREK